ncbi:uncharacterized protein LOC132721027 isoform X1 [Ruditapes philippinarum]|uniref:uncharacterized protein LOC132721027 isoform X1 n=1 Tax=Ruditapes philippinarum TaxID=129788 RepID=UPI00295B7103|nr:uncharacterized protein LOC132721027 isoform X1 [Ruditapes philippinarum]
MGYPPPTMQGRTLKYLRQLMALPFLPVNHIVPTFRELQGQATNPQIVAFCIYLESQWIGNPSFPVSLWCVFRQPVRTNNDVEGWHHRIDRKAGGCSMSFYRLVPLLRREADTVGQTLQLDGRSEQGKISTYNQDGTNPSRPLGKVPRIRAYYNSFFESVFIIVRTVVECFDEMTRM